MARPADRYTLVAVILHWLIAIMVLTLIPVGWWMHEAIEKPETRALAFQTYQLHKSAGLTVLALSLLRLIWRLSHRAPPLPAGMALWEKIAARASHVLFYVLTIAVPLAGWAYVSAGWAAHQDMPFQVPTVWFGLFEVPHISFISDMEDWRRRATAFLALRVHAILAFGMLFLAAIHIAAALKHHIWDRDAVLHHMAPFIKPRQPKAGPQA